MNIVEKVAEQLTHISDLDQMTFSDYLLARLAAQGCDRVFTLTGGGIMFIVDALCRNSSVSTVFVQNEQFAGAAADAYARTRNTVGCALGTTGPGLANLFPSVVSAYQDSSPVLYIGGQVKKSDSQRLNNLEGLRQNGTFEFDAIDCFNPVTKFAGIVEDFADGVAKLEIALREMLEGRPGPALLEVPLDVQSMRLQKTAVLKLLSESNIDDVATGETGYIFDIDAFRAELKCSSAPLLLLGNGVIRAGKTSEMRNLLSRWDLPYVVTPQAIELSSCNAHYGGVVGLRGNRSANILTQQSDHIFIIGCSLHQQTVGWESSKFNPQAKKTWFDIEVDKYNVRQAELNVTRVDRAPVQVLLDEIRKNDDLISLKVSNAWSAYSKSVISSYRKHNLQGKNLLSYYDGIEMFSSIASDIGVLTTDAGTAWYVVPQAFDPKESEFKFITSGAFGAMGLAVPYAVGAVQENCDKYTVAITGDGSLMTSLQELATINQLGGRVVIAVFNNSGYSCIRSSHVKFFEGRVIGTDRSNGVLIPSIEEIAKTFNLRYFKIAKKYTASELKGIIEAEPGHIILELILESDSKIEPAVSSVLINGKFETPSIDVMTPHIDYENFN
jgi:acetolactate synthase-1/2/3 large subunit